MECTWCDYLGLARDWWWCGWNLGLLLGQNQHMCPCAFWDGLSSTEAGHGIYLVGLGVLGSGGSSSWSFLPGLPDYSAPEEPKLTSVFQ